MRRFSLYFKGTSSLLRRSSSPTWEISPQCFSTDINDGSRVKIFDRDLKRKQRERAAWLMRPKDPLIDTVAENLLDRLEDCRKIFPTALCMGGSLQAVRRLLRNRGSIKKLVMMDMSHDMIKACKDSEEIFHDESIETHFLVGDEEFLPIKKSSLDLIISCLGLHWTNDLPGAMIQCKLALKPDGLFLAAILGGETLKELRIACTIAQMEREGGISPRVSPLAQVRDAGNLLTRAGFTLPGVDVDEYVVKYRSALELIEHLRAMGETNALLERSAHLKRDTALATAAIYDSMFALEDGTIPATFQEEGRGGQEKRELSNLLSSYCKIMVSLGSAFLLGLVACIINFKVIYKNRYDGHIYDRVEGAPFTAEGQKKRIRYNFLPRHREAVWKWELIHYSSILRTSFCLELF